MLQSKVKSKAPYEGVHTVASLYFIMQGSSSNTINSHALKLTEVVNEQSSSHNLASNVSSSVHTSVTLLAKVEQTETTGPSGPISDLVAGHHAGREAVMEICCAFSCLWQGACKSWQPSCSWHARHLLCCTGVARPGHYVSDLRQP